MPREKEGKCGLHIDSAEGEEQKIRETDKWDKILENC